MLYTFLEKLNRAVTDLLQNCLIREGGNTYDERNAILLIIQMYIAVCCSSFLFCPKIHTGMKLDRRKNYDYANDKSNGNGPAVV